MLVQWFRGPRIKITQGPGFESYIHIKALTINAIMRKIIYVIYARRRKLNKIGHRVYKIRNRLGSGCGSVGRVVVCDTSDPLFKSSHQKFYAHKIYLLLTVV